MNQVHQITCQWLIRPPTSSKCCITCNKYSFCYNNRLHFIKLKSTRWNYCTFVYNSVLFTADLKFILPIGINLKVSSSYLTNYVSSCRALLSKHRRKRIDKFKWYWVGSKVLFRAYEDKKFLSCNRLDGLLMKPNCLSHKDFGLFPITDCQETQHVIKYTVWVF